MSDMIRTDRPAHPTTRQARAEVAEAYRQGREISDACALTIASWWQSPGRDGRAFAQLSTTGSVAYGPLSDDIYRARRTAEPADVLALDMLATWAINHPSRCAHSWVAGMMAVNEEDLDAIAAVRPVECERCEALYQPTD